MVREMADHALRVPRRWQNAVVADAGGREAGTVVGDREEDDDDDDDDDDGGNVDGG